MLLSPAWQAGPDRVRFRGPGALGRARFLACCTWSPHRSHVYDNCLRVYVVHSAFRVQHMSVCALARLKLYHRKKHQRDLKASECPFPEARAGAQ